MLPASVYLTAPPNLQLPPGTVDQFYNGIETSNGTRKTTKSGRLVAMDQLFFQTLARLNIVPRVAMDIGVSSGVTTLEWLREFEARNMDISLIATDLVMSVYIYSIGRHIKALTERDGHILQVELFGTGIRAYTRWRDYFLGGLIWRNALRTFVRSRLPQSPRNGPYYLVSPLLRQNCKVQLVDDDILAQNSSEQIACADVVRAANVIQRGYFGESEIWRAVRNVRERCRGPGSLIVVCRNRNRQLEGSILRQNDRREFVVEARLGQGSEVEEFFTSDISSAPG